MKRIVLLIVLAWYALPAFSQADSLVIRETKPVVVYMKQQDPRTNIIKLNLLSPFFGTAMVFFEHYFNEEKAVQFGIGYMDYSGSNFFGSGDDKDFTRTFYATAEYRYMLQGEYGKGVYISPFLRFSRMTYTDYELNMTGTDPVTGFMTYEDVPVRYKYTTLGAGMLLGKQYIIRRKVTLDLFAGPVYNFLIGKNRPVNTLETQPGISPLNIKGYGLRAGFAVGFAF